MVPPTRKYVSFAIRIWGKSSLFRVVICRLVLLVRKQSEERNPSVRRAEHRSIMGWNDFCENKMASLTYPYFATKYFLLPHRKYIDKYETNKLSSSVVISLKKSGIHFCPFRGSSPNFLAMVFLFVQGVVMDEWCFEYDEDQEKSSKVHNFPPQSPREFKFSSKVYRTLPLPILLLPNQYLLLLPGSSSTPELTVIFRIPSINVAEHLNELRAMVRTRNGTTDIIQWR